MNKSTLQQNQAELNLYLILGTTAALGGAFVLCSETQLIRARGLAGSIAGALFGWSWTRLEQKGLRCRLATTMICGLLLAIALAAGDENLAIWGRKAFASSTGALFGWAAISYHQSRH